MAQSPPEAKEVSIVYQRRAGRVNLAQKLCQLHPQLTAVQSASSQLNTVFPGALSCTLTVA